ncbi:MAG: hypothetical protein U0M21_07990 [Emergencia sp.]|nr:hypothetical protein [Emergencia sp.]
MNEMSSYDEEVLNFAGITKVGFDEQIKYIQDNSEQLIVQARERKMVNEAYKKKKESGE